MNATVNYAEFELYLSNKLSNQQLIDLEIRLASQPDLKTEFEFYKVFRLTARATRRKQINNYIQTNASTKLVGNIWGNTWTIVSAIFIIIVGLLIWYTDNYQKAPQTNDNNIDTIIKTK